MLAKQDIILFFTRTELQITTVRTGKRPTPVKTNKVVWNFQTLPGLFTQIKKMNAGSVRAVLADELSYVLELSIPLHVTAIQERNYIAEQLVAHIPEVLASNEWDFKETGRTKESKNVLIFAPVKEIYQNLLAACQKSGLRIEALEPAVLASKRDANPIIGLALKKDIRGKDEEVLNVIPIDPNDPSQLLENQKYVHTSHGLKNFILLFVSFLIISIFAGLWLWYNNKIPKLKLSPTPSTVTESPSSPSASPSATQVAEEVVEQEDIDPSSISIQVLNGSGVPGSSSKIKEILLGMGFTKVETGNAESFDYKDITLRKKPEISKTVISSIQSNLSDYTIIESDPLTSDFNYDVLIFVGETYEK